MCTCVHTSLQEGRGDSLPEALKSTHVHLTEQTCAVFFGLGLIQSSKQHPPLYTVIFSNRKCSNFSKQLTEPCDKTDRSVTHFRRRIVLYSIDNLLLVFYQQPIRDLHEKDFLLHTIRLKDDFTTGPSNLPQKAKLSEKGTIKIFSIVFKVFGLNIPAR